MKNFNPKIFDSDCEQKPIRSGYGDGLAEAGAANLNVVALCADLTDSTKTGVFAKKFPERFTQTGISEQNMVSVASGMAAMGKVPFAATYAMFGPGRAWEQIRTTVCYNNQPVKIVGSHAGVTVGPDGGSHQALEDIAIMRTIPNIKVVVPCDYNEAKKATIACASDKSPYYLRLAREKSPLVTVDDAPFQVGRAEILWEDDEPKVAIVACGIMVYYALLSAKKLSEEGIRSIVVNCHTVKPIDKNTLVAIAKKTGRIVSAEEHQVMGGMGSAVAEVLAENYPVPMEFVGIKDRFGESGEPEELLKHFNLTEEWIIEAVRKILIR